MKDALVTDFQYIFDEMKDAAACIDAADQCQKLQSQLANSCTTTCTMNCNDIVNNDVTDKDNKWNDQRQDNCQMEDNPNVIVCLVEDSKHNQEQEKS